MLVRIILTVIVLSAVLLGMQIITHGVGPAVQDDLAIQQVTDPGAAKLLRVTQETQNHTGLWIALGTVLMLIAIWKKPFMSACKKAFVNGYNTQVARNTESAKNETPNQ